MNIDDIIKLGYTKCTSIYTVYRKGGIRLYVDTTLESDGSCSIAYGLYLNPNDDDDHEVYEDIDELYKDILNINRSNTIKQILND